VAFGGVMPGFAETLSGDERRATIAYLQSLWSDEIYGRWLEVDQR
jgi:mono/diheme cytochrome c family protein